MKKMLKSEVCGSREQCIVHERKVNNHSLKKENKKNKMQNVDVGSAKRASQMHTNSSINCLSLLQSYSSSLIQDQLCLSDSATHPNKLTTRSFP